MLVTIGEIIKRFRTEGACVKFSPETIVHMANVIGYTKRRIGGKVGYDKSLITAISQRFKEAVDYEKGLGMKKAQKPLKQPQMQPRQLDYVGYNGERDNVDYEWEKNENRKMKRININESQLHLISEINHLAEKSNVTICSLEDFKSLVSSMGINDGNVEQYVGQYCFIEIGSSFPRVYNEYNVSVLGYDESGNEYNPKSFYKFGQWYFSDEHANVIKLEFDDNQNINNTTANANNKDATWRPRYDKERYLTDKNYKEKVDKEYKEYKLRQEKNPVAATAVNVVHHRNYDPTKTDKQNQRTFYYTRAKEINDEMMARLKDFVDKNLAINSNLKFVLHCRAGQSRSAAIGIYLANKIGQYSEDFLSEYSEQFKLPIKKNSGERSKKYPHQKVLNGLSHKEGWDNGKKKPAAERWWYPEMIKYLEKNGK